MILSTFDYERTILSSLLFCDLSPDERVATFQIEPEIFTHPLHKLVAKTIVKLQSKGYPPSDAYVQELLKIEEQDPNAQNAYIDILAANQVATKENLERYYNILKRRKSQAILKAIR